MKIDKIINFSLSKKFDINFLYQNNIIPIHQENLFVLVACVVPIQKEKLQYVFRKPIKFEIQDKTQIQKNLLDIKYKQDIYDYSCKFLDKQIINETKLVEKIILNIISLCIDKNSSDIHIQSQENCCLFRYRVDGDLLDFIRLDSKIIKATSSVLKLKAGLNISINRTPQDGSFGLNIENKKYDFRCSFVPNVYGESIVIRLLKQNDIQYSLDKLGFENTDKIKHTLNQKSGLVFITGATGSGKTTSLYAILNYLNKENKKIITIEDPVEYKMENIVQIQINEEINLSFENILRNILRQDPDIIMIGEIRDEISLKLAMSASLTGHLVLTTMHTNDAIDTIVRAINLKAKPYMISSSLRLIISQKLSKKVCVYCLKKGCEKCNWTGFAGRVMISESLFVNNKLKTYIEKNYKKTKLIKKLKNSYETITQKTQELIKKGVIVE
ncbi:MAG: type II/IV secretion system protein [Epsilonproteobacteria bacterium]|nr:MAG: type II/IV secretion system protein [Campylobacterota bacterium]